MPNRLILEVGQGSVEVPIKGTVTQIRAAVRRYVEMTRGDTEGKTDAQVGRTALTSFLRQVKSASMVRQEQELIEGQREAWSATLQAENDLFDEPTP